LILAGSLSLTNDLEYTSPLGDDNELIVWVVVQGFTHHGDKLLELGALEGRLQARGQVLVLFYGVHRLEFVADRVLLGWFAFDCIDFEIVHHPFQTFDVKTATFRFISSPKVEY